MQDEISTFERGKYQGTIHENVNIFAAVPQGREKR